MAIELGVDVAALTIPMTVEVASIVGAMDIVPLANHVVRSGVVVDGVSKSNDTLVV